MIEDIIAYLPGKCNTLATRAPGVNLSKSPKPAHPIRTGAYRVDVYCSVLLFEWVQSDGFAVKNKKPLE